MTTNVITASPGIDVEEAYNLMQTNGIRRLPVVDSAGTLVGIVTDRDVRQVLIPWRSSKEEREFYYFASEVKVEEIMTSDVVTVSPQTDIAEVARLIFNHRIGGLPVVDEEEKVVGIITAMDILAVFIEMMGVIGASSRVHVILGDDPRGFETVSKIVRDAGGEIISVGMSGAEGEGADKVYFFRLEPCEPQPIQEALQRAGYTVLATA
ncbi:MAG: CBS and ACT domain-containing protein [Candidatus Tectimicrobiota bacterium]